MLITVLEFLAFTSLWVAAAAAALCTAAGRALGADADWQTLALAAAGTLVIYDIDRLRDVGRDRATSPRRTAFVERWHTLLLGAIGAAAVAALVLAWRAGPGMLAVLVPIAALGFFHRRLKRYAWWKPFYVTGAWTAVAVGLPAAAAAYEVQHVAWVIVVVATAVLSNVVASNLRDGESPSARFGAGVPLRLARALALGSLLIALLSPAPVRPLAMLGLAMLAALAPFRPGELYGAITVDGALLLGALAALLPR